MIGQLEKGWYFLSYSRRESRSERVSRLKSELDESFTQLRKALTHFGEKGCLACLQAHDILVDAACLYNHMATAHYGKDDDDGADLVADPDVSAARLKAYLKDSRKTELLFKFDDAIGLPAGGYACCHCSEKVKSGFIF